MLEGSVPECPWCSAPLTPGINVCPSCGANLTADERGEIPGVTEIDKGAVGVARPPAIITRSRWRAWISGDSSDELTASEAKAVAPPGDAVKQEMLRLELEAQVARLQAETDALLAEAAEEGRTVDIPPELLAEARAASEEGGDAAAADAVEPVERLEGAGSIEPPEPGQPTSGADAAT